MGRETQTSAFGRFFRKLADLSDRLFSRSRFAGSRREVDFIAYAILFGGLIAVGTFIHGTNFLVWNIIFALVVCSGSLFLFRTGSANVRLRALILALLLLSALSSASSRIGALLLFCLLAIIFIVESIFPKKNILQRDFASVVAVLLFCFVAYDAFAVFIEWRRNNALAVGEHIALKCGVASQSFCASQRSSFEVPDFWEYAAGNSNLVKDLQAILPLRTYRDSATENTIALAAFALPPHEMSARINRYLDLQRSFLRSKASGNLNVPLVPQEVLKSLDAQLYVLRYDSLATPGYLGNSIESNALILLHSRADETWLFIIDGQDLNGRDFLLHRIVSGFH
ncbi:MAG: hypothetical protein JSR44_08970 [Spirochaetes bacterium]|nr:hypothetical protein [Spirochaetota bacterium]